jgi:hypothetical protein
MPPAVPEWPARPGSFPLRNAPRPLRLSLLIEQLVLLVPAHHQAHLEAHPHSKPPTACISLVKNMAEASPPLGWHLEHPSQLLLTTAGGKGPTRTPPTHGRQRRRPLRPTQRQEEACQPMPSWHADAPNGRMKAPFAHPGWPRRFTGRHWTQPVHRFALMFLSRAAIPDRQPLRALLLPDLLWSVCTPPEKILNPASPCTSCSEEGG